MSPKSYSEGYLNSTSSVRTEFLVGTSFSKVLFPGLRLGYVVLPSRLLDPVLALRVAVDFYPPALVQATLGDLMTEGHLGRHVRKMRELYANRFGALQDVARRYLSGLLDISPVRGGLSTVRISSKWDVLAESGAGCRRPRNRSAGPTPFCPATQTHQMVF